MARAPQSDEGISADADTAPGQGAAEDGPRPGETPEATIARLLQTVASLRAENARWQARWHAVQATPAGAGDAVSTDAGLPPF